MIRAVIVDDEHAARTRLRDLLADHPDVDIVCECHDGRQALDAIRTAAPDVVFLDVRMPGRDGMEVLEALEGHTPPAVVLVTAHDDYAVRAFDARVLDYLLKPFSVARFRDTLNRVRERLAGSGTDGGGARDDDGRRPARVVLPAGGGALLLDEDEVDWIEAAGNYVRLHGGGRRVLFRETLSRMLGRLPRGRFLRIHRSHIVNLRRVREVRPSAHGDCVVVLLDGTRLVASRTHVPALRRRLGL